MKIVIASPEAVPFVKTGGLADVAGSLLREFRKAREEAVLVMPLYRAVKGGRFPLGESGVTVDVPVGTRGIRSRVYHDGNGAFFLEADEFFDRPELYGTAGGDYADNAARFTFFSRGTLELCRKLSFRPDVIHCHDWQTGLIPLYLKTTYRDDSFFRGTATVLTIHNLGYQGLFPASEMPLTHLGWELFTPEGIEFYGKVNFLKGGLIAADILTTVSETYAREILEPASGFGLDGVLRKRSADLFGIVNGIDYEEWDPSRDGHLPATYRKGELSGKQLCKQELFKSVLGDKAGEDPSRVPLVGMVTRLSEQKGLDLVIGALHGLRALGGKIVILGKGDERFQNEMREAARQYGSTLSLTIGFDEALAHRIYAGADFFLMPSKYEPCGLGQLIALRYGTIPVVRRTGGLADTVEDFHPLACTGTGFLFSDYSVPCMLDALKRAFCVFTDRRKRVAMIRNGMQADFSWGRSAKRYIDIYRAALGRRRE